MQVAGAAPTRVVKQRPSSRDPSVQRSGSISVHVRLFAVGDRVVRNPEAWRPNEFDSWGRGVGIGVVVVPPFPLGPDEVDVRWPGGRCFESVTQLLPAPSASDTDPGDAFVGG